MAVVDPKIICIVGMHRSGTSMIARLLKECGLDLGPDDQLLKADAANPLGHFEHRGFLDIDRKLLKHFGATWYHPPELRPDWHLDPKLKALRAEARSVAAGFADRSHWGWKEPRASLFLPFWKEILPKMRFVICIRDPLEVARSLQKRNRIPVSEGAAIWYRYMRASLEDTEGSPRMFLFFDDFFRNGAVEIRRLIGFCDLPMSVDESQLLGAVSAELRHHHSALQELLEDRSVTSECKFFYLGLRAILSNQPDEIQRQSGAGDHDEGAMRVFVKMFQEPNREAAATTAVEELALERSGTGVVKASSGWNLFGLFKRSR